MAIDVYWGSGSPYSWRVLLALEHKRLAYTSHLLQFSKQEHKSPHMLALNFRGRVPVLKDGDYVVFESLAVLYYLDLKYPEPPLFGRSPEEAGVIMRVICEYQAYTEEHVMTHRGRVLLPQPQPRTAMSSRIPCTWWRARRAPSRCGCRSRTGSSARRFSAADIVIFPGCRCCCARSRKPEARELSSRFLPLEVNYPALARWIARVEALPGYERTYPPHWR